MRSFAILSLGVLVMLPVLEPGGFAQGGFPQRRNVDPNNQPGLEVPVVTPGPGWKACPRCTNGAHMRDFRRKENVDNRPFDKHDLAGVWSGDPMNIEANGTVLNGNTRPPYTPEGQKLFEATISDSVEWSSKDRAYNMCDPFGYPGSLGYNYGFEFVKLPDRVIQFFEIGHWWRTIYTDGRQLPPDPPITRFYGYAVGHWDGDYFVIESNGYDDRTWLARMNAMVNGERRQAGVPHSDQMRITERWKRVNYGLLEVTVTINDPVVFTKPWVSGPHQITLIPGTEMGEHMCVPSDAIDFNDRNIIPALKDK